MQTIGISSNQGAGLAFDSAEIGESRPRGSGRIGHILIAQGKITEDNAHRIRAYAEKKRLRFGEAAAKLGLISRHDIEHAIATQFGYPYLEKGAGGYSNKLVAAFKPFSDKGNALRILRSQLVHHWFSSGQRSLALIGPNGREGCSYIAANLAIMFSQLGASTVLVDAHLQEPTQHRLFNVASEIGLSSALAGLVSVDSVTTRLPLFRDLSLIPAGITPPNVYDLFGRPELAKIIARLNKHFGVVLVDAPPWSAKLGSELIAQKCGGALIVLRKDHSRVADSLDLTKAVTTLGGKVVGCTMNRF